MTEKVPSSASECVFVEKPEGILRCTTHGTTWTTCVRGLLQMIDSLKARAEAAEEELKHFHPFDREEC